MNNGDSRACVSIGAYTKAYMKSDVSRTWMFFLAVFAFSLPILLLGTLTRAHLLPGLPVSALMVLAIAAVTCIFAYHSGGFSQLRALLASAVDIRRTRPWTWHLVATFLMPAVLLIAYSVMKFAHFTLPTPRIAWGEAPFLLALFFAGAVCEEIAWTGTALEPLQKRYGALGAALIIGICWALLHVIPYVQEHPALSWVVGQCLFSVAFRVILVWLYNAMGHSVFGAALCHASYNTAWQLFPNHGSAYNPIVAAIITGLIAMGVTLISTRNKEECRH